MRGIYQKTVSAILICALILTLCILLSSCEPADDGGTAGSISFIDALGRRVALEETPKRVAALLGSFADVWTLAGGELCACPSDAWEDFGLELKDAVNIGGAHTPDLELLLSSDPDFVLASASTASNIEMKDTLEAMGITVAYFDVDDFDDYLEMLRVCTDITGRKDLYEQNGVKIKAEIDSIKDAYKNSESSAEEKKILLLRASSSHVKAKGSRGTVLGEMLSDIGCVNIADTNGSLLENLSIEAIIREEPYHIFVVTMGDNVEAAKTSFYNMMKENSAWGTLEAIREGRVHIMDKTLFNLKPNERWSESYEILYEILTSK